ncbi:hypothetical protein TgHK011_004868 [Trichoderma gracile]|nr:hypothetical protein TgHK011_004868 [Trichoderma gracile]
MVPSTHPESHPPAQLPPALHLEEPQQRVAQQVSIKHLLEPEGPHEREAPQGGRIVKQVQGHNLVGWHDRRCASFGPEAEELGQVRRHLDSQSGSLDVAIQKPVKKEVHDMTAGSRDLEFYIRERFEALNPPAVHFEWYQFIRKRVLSRTVRGNAHACHEFFHDAVEMYGRISRDWITATHSHDRLASAPYPCWQELPSLSDDISCFISSGRICCTSVIASHVECAVSTIYYILCLNATRYVRLLGSISEMRQFKLLSSMSLLPSPNLGELTVGRKKYLTLLTAVRVRNLTRVRYFLRPTVSSKSHRKIVAQLLQNQGKTARIISPTFTPDGHSHGGCRQSHEMTSTRRRTGTDAETSLGVLCLPRRSTIERPI